VGSEDDNNSGGAGGDKTFTRAEVRAMIAAEVKKVREQFADYDELKQQADTAKGDASKLDKLTAAVEALTSRAEKAEGENTRRSIADEFGLTPKEARRLSGKTADELRADAEEFVADMGIDVKARKEGKTGSATAGTGDKGDANGEGEGADGGNGGQQGGESEDTSRRTPAPARAGRPRENLRSGTPATTDGDADLEKLDPLELIKGVPRR
jgi:hypothetical protein